MNSISNRGLLNRLAPPGLCFDATDLQSQEAKFLESYVESIQQHSMSSAYGRQALPEHLANLTYGHPGITALASLRKGWDGYDSDRPSKIVLDRAKDVWDLVVGAFGRALGMPDVTPTGSGKVAFTWKLKKPSRQLELWVHDDSLFSADWCLLLQDGSTTDGELCILDDVIPVLRDFIESD